MNTVRRSRRLGIIGSVVGLLALVVSALTQLLPAQLPPGPVGQATEQVGPNDKDHLIFRTKRFEIRSHEASSREASEPRASEQRTTGTTWNQVLATAAAALGLLAIALSVFAVILREEKLLAGVAAVLGVAAIAVQVWWVLVVVAAAIVIINAFLS